MCTLSHLWCTWTCILVSVCLHLYMAMMTSHGTETTVIKNPSVLMWALSLLEMRSSHLSSVALSLRPSQFVICSNRNRKQGIRVEDHNSKYFVPGTDRKNQNPGHACLPGSVHVTTSHTDASQSTERCERWATVKSKWCGFALKKTMRHTTKHVGR